MNILFLSDANLTGFGETSHIYNVATALARLNHNVKLMCRKGKKSDKEVAFSVKMIGNPGRFNAILYPLQLLVHAAIYIATARVDLIYERQGLVPVGFLMSKFFGKPLVVAAQGVAFFESEATLQEALIKFLNNRIIARILKTLRKINLKRASKIIAVTPEIKRLICSQYGIDHNKIVTGSNGVDTSIFKPIEVKKAKLMLGLDEEKQYICFAGGLNNWAALKLGYLIRSAPLVLQKCPLARFLVVGDGARKDELIKLAQQVGVFGEFVFTGAVPYENVPIYIASSEVCVDPVGYDAQSRIAGTSSLKVFEYMACGKPVVTGLLEGDIERVSKSNAGRAVNSGDPWELAGAIIELLENKQSSKRLGENGRAFVLEGYDWTTVAERIAQVCRTTIREPT